MNIKIHNIGGYVLKNYILETPLGIIAIDTGYLGGFKKFKSRFEKLYPLSKLKYIFLTHHHDDHSGFLNDIMEQTNAKVVVHHLAVYLLKNGKNNIPTDAGYSSVPASMFGRIKKDFTFPPVNIRGDDIVLHSENEQFFTDNGIPLQIVFLPGHTEDSMGLFLPETGQLFCGDAAMNAIISVAYHTIWIEDAKEYGCSWDKMLSLNPVRIYPSHGIAFSSKCLTKYRHFLDNKKLIQLK